MVTKFRIPKLGGLGFLEYPVRIRELEVVRETPHYIHFLDDRYGGEPRTVREEKGTHWFDDRDEARAAFVERYQRSLHFAIGRVETLKGALRSEDGLPAPDTPDGAIREWRDYWLAHGRLEGAVDSEEARDDWGNYLDRMLEDFGKAIAIMEGR